VQVKTVVLKNRSSCSTFARESKLALRTDADSALLYVRTIIRRLRIGFSLILALIAQITVLRLRSEEHLAPPSTSVAFCSTEHRDSLVVGFSAHPI
jgi:hypothetical protein